MIERRSNLSVDEFRAEYSNRPVIIENAMAGWQALWRWTPQYLKDMCGDELIEVMVDGARYRRNIPFATLIDYMFSNFANRFYSTGPSLGIGVLHT